jgi:flagellar assembly protein FliH
VQIPGTLRSVHLGVDRARQEKLERERLIREAYERGRGEAEDFARAQLVEARTETSELQSSVLHGVEKAFEDLRTELDQNLPELVLALVQRVLRGVELDGEAIRGLVLSTVEELAPRDEPLTLFLHPQDHHALSQRDEELAANHPRLRFQADPELKRGDVQVRSRFGVIDARTDTKVDALRRELQPSETQRETVLA